MRQRLLTAAILFGIGVAEAASGYRVNLYRATVVNGVELKAGECKLEVQGDKVVLKQGKTTAEATVKLETNPRKFDSTTVGYAGDGSGRELQEIRLGGTAMKLVFETGAAGSK